MDKNKEFKDALSKAAELVTKTFPVGSKFMYKSPKMTAKCEVNAHNTNSGCMICQYDLEDGKGKSTIVFNYGSVLAKWSRFEKIVEDDSNDEIINQAVRNQVRDSIRCDAMKKTMAMSDALMRVFEEFIGYNVNNPEEKIKLFDIVVDIMNKHYLPAVNPGTVAMIGSENTTIVANNLVVNEKKATRILFAEKEYLRNLEDNGRNKLSDTKSVVEKADEIAKKSKSLVNKHDTKKIKDGYKKGKK